MLHSDRDPNQTYRGDAMNPDLKFPLVQTPSGLQFFLFKREALYAMDVNHDAEEPISNGCGCASCACGQAVLTQFLG